MPKIKIYTTPTCPYCIKAKEYFKSKRIAFEEIDVAQNQERAQEMIKISGSLAVPVIQIGKEVIIGFDKEKIEKALKSKI